MCGFEGTYLFGPVAQLVRAPPCHGGGHGFESRLGRFIWDLSSAGRASALQAEGHRFEPCRSHSSEKLMELNMARWLNWLERPVHTREVESSSLSLATIQACGHGSQAFCYIIKT